MKYLLSITLLLTGVTSYCQQKKDTKIVVTVADTTNLLNRIAAAVYDNGFSLDEKDLAVGFLLTKPKYESKVVGFRKIRAFIKGNTVEFSGLCRWDVKSARQDEFEPVMYRGMKGSLYKVAWKEMEEIAMQFGSISYSR